MIIANVIYHGLVATYWISLRAELLRLRAITNRVVLF